MATLTDHLRAGAYIAWEPEGVPGIYTREQGTLLSGNLKAGTILMGSDSANLVALTEVGTAGVPDATIQGILFDDVDASVSPQPAVYTARLTAVRGDDLIYPHTSTAGDDIVTINAALKALGIIVR